MDTLAKRNLTALKEEERFLKLVKKITLRQTLSNEEWSFILSCSLILSEKYNETKNDGYFQFAYYLILSYSLSTKDWEPLYQFSTAAGFYPVSDYLYNTALENNRSIADVVINGLLHEYKDGKIVFIRDQKEKIDDLCKSQSRHRAFIAPTSYGKSDFIKKDIERIENAKIGIIVPSKALIWQTFNNIKPLARKKNMRVLVHDSEYDGEDSFIGVFTQERALRLIQDNEVSFDVLYIDEAHNIFEFDNRQILLTRLIRLNQKSNPNQRIVYLSPLIKDVRNLTLKGETLLVDEKRINKSIKEYEILYRSKNGASYRYNRFIDEKWQTSDTTSSIIEYLQKEKGKKNLLYFYRPREIERFTRELISNIETINSQSLNKISDVISKYADEDYLMTKAIQKGVIYIHSKIPEILKDYLYDCFKNVEEIKFLVSNNCVLEGVNFPIDSLFILNSYALMENDVINLAGRVNRLNNIFDGEKTDLNKLFCRIHFVESDYSRHDMCKKLSYFRADLSDSVENPILSNAKSNDKKEDKINKIIETENLFLSEKSDSIQQTFIKNGIDRKYKSWEESFKILQERITHINKTTDIKQTMAEIKKCFIDGMAFSDDSNALFRLTSDSTNNYYSNYIGIAYHNNLKAKIAFVLNNFEYTLKNNPIKLSYIGKTFGQVRFKETDFFPAYIDLTVMDDVSKINYAIIKTKVEDDFIDYELMPFVKTLFDLGTVSEGLYNIFAYGTSSQALVYLRKFGFSASLIKFLQDNNLLSDLTYCGYGFKATDKFKQKINELDGLMRFEIKKYLVG